MGCVYYNVDQMNLEIGCIYAAYQWRDIFQRRLIIIKMQCQKGAIASTAIKRNLYDAFSQAQKTTEHISPSTIIRESSLLDSYNRLNNYSEIMTQSVQRCLEGERARYEEYYNSEHCRLLETERMMETRHIDCDLQISALRQSHFQHIQTLEKQLRALKEEASLKKEEYSKAQLAYQRDIALFEKQDARLKQEIKLIIAKKNQEITQVEQFWTEKIAKIQSQHQTQLQELSKLRNSQQQGTARPNDSAMQHKLLQQEKQKHQQLITEYEEKLKQKQSVIEEMANRTEEKCLKLKGIIDQVLHNSEQNIHSVIRKLTDSFELQCQQLMKVIKVKEYTNSQLEGAYEANKVEFQSMHQCTVRQFEQLKNKLKSERRNFMEQLQLTKVKIAALHENDCRNIISLYERKTEHLKSLLNNSQQQNEELRRFLVEESGRKVEAKRKHDNTVSELRSQLMKTRVGMENMENECRDRLENERSIMMMTSKSLMKDVEAKEQNNRFHQQELRKLRQLMEIKDREVKHHNQVLEEKILSAADQQKALKAELDRRNADHQHTEDHFRTIIANKDAEIVKLLRELKDIVIPIFDNSINEKEICDLRDQLNLKIDEIVELKDKLSVVEEKLKTTEAAMEQYHIQASINQQEAKKHYKDISDANLAEHRVYYEEKIISLKHEKEELEKIISNKKGVIYSLKKEQEEMKSKMKEMLRLLNQRTDLENKVMKLGLDECLVANLTSIMSVIR